MKIDFSTLMTTLEGQPVKNENDKDVTLGMAAVNALLANDPTEKAIDKKVASFKLAVKISQANEPIEITPEEAVLIKTRISATFPSPLMIGRAAELLNG